jgi:2,4-dienoyl-CoA reductase (NADPH2)
LDRIFTDRIATCLVNPRAGREIEFDDGLSNRPRRVAVIGGGPAGMAFAVNAAQRGHQVTLFEAGQELGGQLNMARQVPGKNEFNEMLRYFRVSLQRAGSVVRLNTRITPAELAEGHFDEIVIATGVSPRTPEIPGINHPKVLSYVDVLTKRVQVGQRVAIIGAGGIGFDVAEFLVGDAQESLSTTAFMSAWGVDTSIKSPGGLAPAASHPPRRTIHMFQRKSESLGKNLGKSTGWILKAKLRKAGVAMTGGATYDAIDDVGLHYTVNGERRVAEVDHVILCAGQNSNRELYDALQQRGVTTHLIGGADVATELDALRAIDQATRLAVSF